MQVTQGSHFIEFIKKVTNAASSSPHGAGNSSTAVRMSARDIPKTLLAIQKSRLLSHKLLIPTESKDGNEGKFGYKVVKGLLGKTTYPLFLSRESANLNVLQKSLNILGPCLSNIIMHFFLRPQCMSCTFCTRLLLIWMLAFWAFGSC
jgi:hypothetical protein